jgi:hypothetical protein
MYGPGAASAATGAMPGGISGALSGGAVPAARGAVPGYETIVRNCMRGMGHMPVE